MKIVFLKNMKIILKNKNRKIIICLEKFFIILKLCNYSDVNSSEIIKKELSSLNLLLKS